jgi:hypothetical protein
MLICADPFVGYGPAGSNNGKAYQACPWYLPNREDRGTGAWSNSTTPSMGYRRIGSWKLPCATKSRRAEVYSVGGKLVRVHSAAKDAKVDPAGKHTSVVASVVYLFG